MTAPRRQMPIIVATMVLIGLYAVGIIAATSMAIPAIAHHHWLIAAVLASAIGVGGLEFLRECRTLIGKGRP
jgi:hypothetical protein